MRLTNSSGFHFRRCISSKTAKSTSASTAKSGATLRSSIARSIAKNFKNVSLVDFPLMKPSALTDYSAAIEKAHQSCRKEHLDDNPNYYPSISTILNQTMSPESMKALKRWEAEKIKQPEPMAEKIKQLGYDGFQAYRKELFSRGKILHSNIRTYLETRDTSKLQFSSAHQENMWKSVEHVMPKISTLYASEYPVHHPLLKYRGILDSVATYYEVPTIFEWKTSEKLKPTVAHTYDNPLQAVAYFSCLQYDQLGQLEAPVKEVILVIAYEDGSKANVHILEPSLRVTLWKKFLKRLELYWSQQASG